jgi:hypothetical protein
MKKLYPYLNKNKTQDKRYYPNHVRKKNKKINPKKSTILKLDFDKVNQKELISIIKSRKGALWLLKYQTLRTKVFKTRNGFHIYITINKNIPNKDTVFLQACLGSDIYRECHYWKRIKYPILPNKQWNILFQKKEYQDGTISKEIYKPSLTNKIHKILTNKVKYRKKRRSKQ